MAQKTSLIAGGGIGGLAAVLARYVVQGRCAATCRSAPTACLGDGACY